MWGALYSMDKIKVPQNISIPIAVMFRFFPSFKEEWKNIKMAMKIRGITFKTPFILYGVCNRAIACSFIKYC